MSPQMRKKFMNMAAKSGEDRLLNRQRMWRTHEVEWTSQREKQGCSCGA